MLGFINLCATRQAIFCNSLWKATDPDMTKQKLRNNLRAVTLDLWQTLIIDAPQRGVARAALRIDGILRVLQKAGLSLTREQVEEAYRACAKAHWEMQGRAQDCSFQEQVDEFLRLIDPDLPSRADGLLRHQVAQRYARPFLAFPPALAPGARQVLEALRERGYRVGLISNTGMTPGSLFRDYLQELGVLHHFDALVFSDEVGLSKPAPGIFQRALDALGVPAAQAAHVGDSLRSDVAGAKGAGMAAVWLQGHDDSEPEVPPDATITRLAELVEVI